MQRSIARLLFLASLVVFRCEPSSAQIDAPQPIVAQPNIKTARLGGVDIPAVAELKKMHASQYILRARQGALTRVPVRRVLLPHDGSANPQSIQLIKAPQGVIYANLASLICKSTDGGLTWSAHAKGGPVHGAIAVLRDGTFLLLRTEGKHPKTRPIALTSTDEGRTWRKIAEIQIPPKHWGSVMWMKRTQDDVLLAGIGHVNHVFEDVDGRSQLKSGSGRQLTYRSRDGGRSWQRLGVIHDWVSEGGIAVTSSGKLLAALRYQRPTMPGDAADLEKRNGSVSVGWPWKHVFLSDSKDGGKTWTRIRQLTTIYGQTRGYPVALTQGTVVVIHDTRYGPGSPGSRAMISHDEGASWRDEVYYLDYTTFTGSYNASVRLDGDTILTVAGSSQAGKSWEAIRGKADFYAIRWKPLRR